ncbi:MAG: hypothetical protein JW818_20515 [Pirellulales bacterium]|nr:hypothetical protein [Pirellulales bacterium]
MTSVQEDPRRALRRTVYALLITVSAGAMLGRILAVDAVDKAAVEQYRIKERLHEKEKLFREQGLKGEALEEALDKEYERLAEKLKMHRPFMSANDRSRLCAIRALVEEDMRVRGAPYAIDRVIQERTWDTIDMVKHIGPDKKPHLYSSKPPLYPTLLAGEYWIIHRLTGMTLGTHPYTVGRVLLVINNLIPMVLGLFLLAQLVERLGTTDWGRIFVMAAACFGTFLTTFAVTINNHLVGAVSVIVALWAVANIWLDGRRHPAYFILAGLAGGFAVANELPALVFLAMLGGGLLLRFPRLTLLAFTPAVAFVAVAFFGTNYIAHNDLKPPYMHRVEGDNWYDYTYKIDNQEKVSHWRDPGGLDAGEPSNAVYSLHALVGHHGIFSLTPMWLLSVVGVVLGLRRREPGWRSLALLIGVVSVVCLVFFLFIEKNGRNYGGMTCGFRWVFWMAPLWLLAMLPTVDALSHRRSARAFALILLALSVLSASYPTWNPWSHPWLMRYLEHLGWL